ncbi:MAG: hypothetical protein AB1657_00545 [Candidatus Micrarchaeota archaeon]
MAEKTGRILNGLLLLLAGLSFLAFALGYLDVRNAHLLVGALLALVGLHKIGDAYGICPLCK